MVLKNIKGALFVSDITSKLPKRSSEEWNLLSRFLLTV